jgi:hypothetical protein
LPLAVEPGPFDGQWQQIIRGARVIALDISPERGKLARELIHGFNLYGAPARSAIADLEDLCSQSHGGDCGN